MPLNIGQIVKEHGSKAALDDIEKEKSKELDIEATGDGKVEVDLNAEVTKGPAFLKGGTVTGFVKAAVNGAKEWAWGARFKKKF